MLIGAWVHLFPSRTQKLSTHSPTILAGRLAGKIGNANITNPLADLRKGVLLRRYINHFFTTGMCERSRYTGMLNPTTLSVVSGIEMM